MKANDREVPPEIVKVIAAALLFRDEPAGGLFGKVAYRARTDAKTDEVPWHELFDEEERP